MTETSSKVFLSLETDRFEDELLIGTGGFGSVYRATDTTLQRTVAVKVLNRTDDAALIQRFKREAQVLSHLEHKNIVKISRFGLLQTGEPFLVMEHLNGKSLRELLDEEKTLPCAEAARIAMELAEALAYAHNHGIVHRDVKPDNVMMTDDGIKLLDFGICAFDPALQDGKVTLTRTGSVVGTVAYISPEQCTGNQVDARSDIYSLGTMLFEMIAGEPPFPGENAANTVWKHLNYSVPDITKLHPEANLPSALRDLIFTCMEKDREQRFQSAAQLAAALEPLTQSSCEKVDPSRADRTIETAPIKKSVVPKALPIALCICALLATTFATMCLYPPLLVPFVQKLSDHPVATLIEADRIVLSTAGFKHAERVARTTLDQPQIESWTQDDKAALTYGYFDLLASKGDPPVWLASRALDQTMVAIRLHQDSPYVHGTLADPRMYRALARLTEYYLEPQRSMDDWHSLRWMTVQKGPHWQMIHHLEYLKGDQKFLRAAIAEVYASAIMNSPNLTVDLKLHAATALKRAADDYIFDSEKFDYYINDAIEYALNNQLRDKASELYLDLAKQQKTVRLDLKEAKKSCDLARQYFNYIPRPSSDATADLEAMEESLKNVK